MSFGDLRSAVHEVNFDRIVEVLKEWEGDPMAAKCYVEDNLGCLPVTFLEHYDTIDGDGSPSWWQRFGAALAPADRYPMGSLIRGATCIGDETYHTRELDWLGVFRMSPDPLWSAKQACRSVGYKVSEAIVRTVSMHGEVAEVSENAVQNLNLFSAQIIQYEKMHRGEIGPDGLADLSARPLMYGFDRFLVLSDDQPDTCGCLDYQMECAIRDTAYRDLTIYYLSARNHLIRQIDKEGIAKKVSNEAGRKYKLGLSEHPIFDLDDESQSQWQRLIHDGWWEVEIAIKDAKPAVRKRARLDFAQKLSRAYAAFTKRFNEIMALQSSPTPTP